LTHADVIAASSPAAAEPVLTRHGLLPEPGLVPSRERFPDGAQFRIEIPSVEGPRVLEAVLDAAREHDVVVNRVSQGSGAMLLREVELRDLAALGAEAGLEVSLFVGPRESFGIGAHARSADGAAHGGQLRGTDQLAYAIEDVARAVEAGIRGFLVADLGLLGLLRDMQAAGELPAACVWKVSVLMAPSNAASLRVLEQLGAGTVNIPSDVTLDQLAGLRAASGLPLDLYVESPDGLGGVVRGNEAGALVTIGAPLYVKLGLRNARALYPAGDHLVADASAIAREKVRRAALALEWIRRLHPELRQSAAGAEGLAVPAPVNEGITAR
jgi:Peptidase family U32